MRRCCAKLSGRCEQSPTHNSKEQRGNASSHRQLCQAFKPGENSVDAVDGGHPNDASDLVQRCSSSKTVHGPVLSSYVTPCSVFHVSISVSSRSQLAMHRILPRPPSDWQRNPFSTLALLMQTCRRMPIVSGRSHLNACRISIASTSRWYQYRRSTRGMAVRGPYRCARIQRKDSRAPSVGVVNSLLSRICSCHGRSPASARGSNRDEGIVRLENSSFGA